MQTLTPIQKDVGVYKFEITAHSQYVADLEKFDGARGDVAVSK